MEMEENDNSSESMKLKTKQEIHEDIYQLYSLLFPIPHENLALYLKVVYAENDLNFDEIHPEYPDAIQVIKDIIKEKTPSFYDWKDHPFVISGFYDSTLEINRKKYSVEELKKELLIIKEYENNPKYNIYKGRYTSRRYNSWDEDSIMRALENGDGDIIGH